MPRRDAIIGHAFGHARVTPQRRKIARAAAAMSGAFTIDELIGALRAASPEAAASATVYRAVAAMEASGYLTRAGERCGAALYVRCGAGTHHHHVICDGCGRVAHTTCPLGPFDATVPGPDGFVVTRHEVILYGLCPACAMTGSGA